MPSRSLQDADKRLREAVVAVINDFPQAAPGRSLVITCTYRSPEEQLELYREGRALVDGRWEVQDGTRIVTQLSGAPGHQSNHNLKPARAVDVAVTVGGKITWDFREYLPLGPLAVKHGLVWGGDWPHLKDFPHLELPQEA